MAAKPFQCLLCNKSYTNKASLVTHERKAHNQNIIVPHYHILFTPLYSSYCHFRGLFIDAIQSRLGSHRATEGKKKVQVHCEENLFYFIFREQETFTFQVSSYKYSCIFKVNYQQQDPITKKFIDKEIGFSWKRKLRKIFQDGYEFIYFYGVMTCSFSTYCQTICIEN
ncbi:13828_t:CDS:2 [Gigaspora margarita]|uniref:13828_t:CDS:1 n=1 Tax=Gigaspora margarita TaxID=4874 RepID=A0ABN7W9M1_GIGMA|nr:13828_t:CDS:2 [Gigaspora margarita]